LPIHDYVYCMDTGMVPGHSTETRYDKVLNLEYKTKSTLCNIFFKEII